jgi:ubiquinone/menaquinone biosynthesis C-methylase UbiE
MEANIWNLCKFETPILDIGIGNGKLTNLLFRGHPQIEVGIDIEESGLEMARALEMSKGKKRYKKVMHANAEKMPFKDRTFNTVVSNSTFEHIDNDLKAVSEVARVLKKGGLFFLTLPSEYLPQWILEYEKMKDSNKAEEQLEKFNKRTVHLHYRSVDYWSNYFKKNNMKLVFNRYYFPKNVALYWYKIVKIFIHQINNRELWSYLGHSKLTKVLPKKVIINLLEKRILKNAYNHGFFTNSELGGQMFMVAKKN